MHKLALLQDPSPVVFGESESAPGRAVADAVSNRRVQGKSENVEKVAENERKKKRMEKEKKKQSGGTRRGTHFSYIVPSVLTATTHDGRFCVLHPFQRHARRASGGVAGWPFLFHSIGSELWQARGSP